MRAEKRVRDVMHPGAITCAPSITLTEAARLMQAQNVRALIVTDASCGMIGIVSQSDLVNAALKQEIGDAWHHLTAAEAMTRHVVTVSPDDALARAAKLMIDHRIHRLVVTDEADPCTPIGVLSMGDLVRDMMNEVP